MSAFYNSNGKLVRRAASRTGQNISMATICHDYIEGGFLVKLGTQKATKAFKDRDLVELNVYDGTARKLQ